jgi:hypothetical protein
LRERERKVAGAAAQIERTVPGFHGGKLNDAAFPTPVEAETLKVVEQIITPGDGGKKVINLRGALFTGNVKRIVHGGSLTDGPVEKSKGM